MDITEAVAAAALVDVDGVSVGGRPPSRAQLPVAKHTFMVISMYPMMSMTTRMDAEGK